MPAQRVMKHLTANEIMEDDSYLLIQDVHEDHWLLEHSHEFLEIVFVLKGKGTQYIDGVSKPSVVGECYVIPIGTTHVFRPAPGNTAPSPSALQVRDVLIRKEWLEQLNTWLVGPEMEVWISRLLGHSVEHSPTWFQIQDETGALLRLTEQLKNLLQQKPSLYQSQVLAALIEFLTILGGATECGQLQTSQWPPRSQHLSVKEQLLLAVKSLSIETFTLKEVAIKLNWSERHTARLFQSHFGSTFTRFAQQYRIAASMELLKQSSASVQHIMKQIGFQDAEHFYYLFKRTTGLTPGQYRRQSIMITAVTQNKS